MNIKKLNKEIEEARKLVDSCNRLIGYSQDNKVERAAAMGTYLALLAVKRCADETPDEAIDNLRGSDE